MALGPLSTLVPLGLREAFLIVAVILYGGGALFGLTSIAGAVWVGRSVRRGRERRAVAVAVGLVAACLGGAATWMLVTLAIEKEATWALAFWGALAVSLFGAAVFALTSRPPR